MPGHFVYPSDGRKDRRAGLPKKEAAPQPSSGRGANEYMAVKINIRKIVSFTLWSIVGTGVMILLVAAIRYRNNNVCKGYKINISGSADTRSSGSRSTDAFLFIDNKEVMALLAPFGVGKALEKPVYSFDLRHMETALEKNAWVKDAQLFFDNNNILRVNVTEREPIARIFTVDGNSFYLDSSGMQLPLSDKFPARLPVFTSYPAKIRTHGPDSALTIQVTRLADFIRNDPFWMAQIAQVDITPGKTFELSPMIGDQVIGLGDGNDLEQKFHRLFVFYKEVLSQTGFSKYSRIDVAYAGQVIGTLRGSEGSRLDSVQGMNNIRQLIRQAQHFDTTRQNTRPLEHSMLTEQNLTTYDLIPGDSSGQGPVQGVAVREPAHHGPANGGTARDPAKPKAIMPKPNKKPKNN